MANAGEKKKLSVEPITAVCAVILLIACATVIAVDINTKFIEKHDIDVAYGDTVVVDYTGSLYTYYDDVSGTKKAVIFDTSLAGVGNDKENYLFTGSFNKTTFEPLTLTLGEGKALAAFEKAIMGAKVGQTVSVVIPADQAYPASNNNVYATTLTSSNVYNLTVEEFTKFYGMVPSAGYMEFEKDDFKISANTVGNNVTVQYILTAGDKIIVSDSALGKVTMDVDTVIGSIVTYSLLVENPIKLDKVIYDQTGGHGLTAIEMICLHMFPNHTMNIVGAFNAAIIYNESGYDETSKQDATIFNNDLYFKIKILSKE